MAIATGVSIASLVTGWISFALTILTWLGVYISLILTIKSAPQEIPLTLSNIRQELQAEKSFTKHSVREGDRYRVFPGRHVRRIGKNESHIRLMEATLDTTWKDFKALEERFIVKGDQRNLGEVEDRWTDMDSESSGEVELDEKIGVKHRGNGGRRMRRRESHLKNRMGYWDAGISIDRQVYYNTDFRHRVLWWWKQNDVKRFADQVQRLQIRRIEQELFETDELVKRSLWVLGGMSGEDVLHPLGPPYSKNGPGAGLKRRRSHRARSKRASSRSLNQQASRSVSRARDSGGEGVREVYEKEIRRVRRRSDSRGSDSGSPSRPPKVAGSTVSRRDSAPRNRVPTVVEYEVVNPGRVWVDVEPSQNDPPRGSNGRRMSRPQPAHFESYVREREPRGQ